MDVISYPYWDLICQFYKASSQNMALIHSFVMIPGPSCPNLIYHANSLLEFQIVVLGTMSLLIHKENAMRQSVLIWCNDVDSYKMKFVKSNSS